MFSSPHILEDFIYPLSTCSTKADLDTIVKIAQSSQNPMIAVLDETECPIGIINGCRLLIFIFKKWSQVSQNSTKFVDEEQRETDGDLADCFKLVQWIEPIVSLKSDLSIEQIISYLNKEIITKSHGQNYIVTDTEGKLLGLLDTFRLSQWLLSSQIELDPMVPQQKTQKATSSSPIFKLIEQIPLPLMLEKSSGEALYKNQFWQQQVGIAKISNSLEVSQFIKSLNSNLSLSNSLPNDRELTPYCLKGNYYLSPCFANLSPQKITDESQKILDTITEKKTSISGQLLTEEQLELPNSNSDLLTLQPKKNEWRYIKLPLNYTEHKLVYTNLTPQVWLLIAIKIVSTGKLAPQPPQETELVKLNQLKDKFLANISHELKSPLTSIVGLSSLLKEGKLGQLNKRQIRYSELIYRSGRQLMKIVSDIVELTYLATGKLNLNFELIKIKSLCTEVYQQVLTRLEESNQLAGKPLIKPQFKLSIEKDSEMISADKMRLRQILTYLLENALKFVQWKEATLSTPQKNIAITINHWSNWIAITIIDNGIGVAEETQSLLLEQCFARESYQEHPYNDIVLGLIMAQQLAKAHGGDISFTSCWGRGSKFTVLLPDASIKIAPETISNLDSITSLRQSLELSYYNYHHLKKSPNHRLGPQDNLLVLIIDSVVTQINQLDLKLKELGYYPIIARNTTEALQKARQFKPSKIMLNCDLSKVSGTDILTLLKSDPLTAKIPVFLLVDKLRKQHKYIQADGFLTVPIKQKSLMKIVPLVKKDVSQSQKCLTILHLYPESEITSHLKIIQNSDLNFALNEHLSGLNHRVLEADSLEQGELLARIWQIDAIVLDGRILQEPLLYLRSLRKSASLSSLPLVTLDAKTTEAANQIEGLSVFPCLLPEEKSNLANLVQVIQIAAGIKNNQ